MVSAKRAKRWLSHFIAWIISYFPSERDLWYDLVIVRVDALGDYVIWRDALSAYKERFENKRVLMVCADIASPLAIDEPFFTDVYVFSREKASNKFHYLIQTVRYLKTVSSEMVISPTWNRHPLGDIFVAQIKSSQKIGMESKGKSTIWNRLCRRQYSNLISYSESPSEIKSVEYFTQKAIWPNYQYGFNPLVINKAPGMEIHGDYVVVAFSASTKAKSWETYKFAKVIDAIPQKYQVVLTGHGNEDIRRALEIAGLVKDKQRIINMVSKTSVVELVSLISKSILVIGNDSAAVHIAAATRVKSVCILIGAQFNRFFPYPKDLPFLDYIPQAVYYRMDCYGCNYRCVYNDENPYNCLKNISEDMVISEVINLLGEG